MDKETFQGILHKLNSRTNEVNFLTCKFKGTYKIQAGTVRKHSNGQTVP